MAVMALGPFAFEAMGFSFTDFETQVDTPWASIPIAGGPSQLQWTGAEGSTRTINGVLFPAEFGGQESLDGLVMAANAGMALPLVSLGLASLRNIFGLWVIEGVREHASFIDGYGETRRNEYSIDLRSMPAGAGGIVGAAVRALQLF